MVSPVNIAVGTKLSSEPFRELIMKSTGWRTGKGWPSRQLLYSKIAYNFLIGIMLRNLNTIGKFGQYYLLSDLSVVICYFCGYNKIVLARLKLKVRKKVWT